MEMNDLRTAAHQALEALSSSLYPQPRQMAAIAALRAALAQPLPDPVDEYRKGFIDGQIDMRDRPEEQKQEQEPVAWWKRHRDGSVELNDARTFIAEDAIAAGRRPLIFGDTSPPQRPA